MSSQAISEETCVNLVRRQSGSGSCCYYYLQFSTVHSLLSGDLLILVFEWDLGAKKLTIVLMIHSQLPIVYIYTEIGLYLHALASPQQQNAVACYLALGMWWNQETIVPVQPQSYARAIYLGTICGDFSVCLLFPMAVILCPSLVGLGQDFPTSPQQEKTLL